MNRNTIETILGRKGYGKTTLAAELLEDERRAIVLDTMGGYGHVVDRVVWGFDASVEAMLQASKERRFRLALRVYEQDEWLGLLDMAWELEDYLLVVEETSIVCGTPPFLHGELSKLVRFGRHRQISQIYIARRPTEIPRDLTAQSDHVITFQQTEPRDLQFLQALGFDPTQVAGLPKYRVAAIDHTNGEDPLPLPVTKRLFQQRLPLKQAPPLDSSLTDDPEDDTSQVDEPEPASEG